MIYKTKGVCSQAIEVEVDGDTVKSVQFVGGCNGNTKGIAQLVAGMKVWLQANFLSGSACQSSERDQGTAVVLNAEQLDRLVIV